MPNRSTAEAHLAMKQFQGPDTVVYFYSDNAPELINASKEMKWAHDPALPYRPETDGVAENKVKDVVNGARTLLQQAGLPEKWWPYAA